MARRLAFTEPAPVRQKMALVHINDMFAYILRCTRVMDIAMMHLRPEHFDQDSEPQYGLLWAVIMGIQQENGRVDYKTLNRELSLLLEDNTDTTLSRSQAAVLQGDQGLPHWVFYELENTNLDPDAGAKLLREFLVERAVIAPFEDMISDGAARSLDFSDLFSEYQRRSDRINTIGKSSAHVVMPDEWQGLSISGNRVGVAAFDGFMPDGDAAGECYGIIGVTGGGKTMSMVDLAITRARWYHQNPSTDGKTPVVVFVSYEEPPVQMRCRMLARAARVDKRNLEQAKSYDDLTRRGRGGFHEYEIAMFKADGIPLDQAPGEYDRLMEARAWVNRHIVLLDMSGTESDKGDGYIDELRQELQSYLAAHNNTTIGLILVDYAGLMIERYLTAEGKDFNEMRHWIRAMGTELNSKIAKPFNSPLWIAQQFSGEANKKSATARMHHADAAEGKSFANGLVYCFGIGSVDPNTRICQLHCTKDRRTGNNAKSTVVKLDGQFQRILDVSSEYRVDSATNSIVANRVAAEFSGAAPRQPVRRQANNGFGAVLD